MLMKNYLQVIMTIKLPSFYFEFTIFQDSLFDK